MLQDFLNNTCTIKQITTTLVGWESVKTETAIYTNISCYYYRASARLDETNLAENTNLSSYKVILEANKTLVRQWMFIDVSDPDLWNIWKYKIDWVKVWRLIDGSRDHIELVVSAI